jgi:metal-sulfur cluster biosynthetic enzyme
MATVTVDDVQEALTNVIDPELGLDFVELGLIYEVEVDGGDVNIAFTLTSPGCPIGPQVAEQIDEFVSELEGVASVQSRMTFSPAWTPDMMSEEAKFALGY